MPGLSVDLVVHKLPTYPDYPPVQQKQRKCKTDIIDKIKEEVTKQLKVGVHGDLIHAPPTELHPMSTPWPFVAWGMDAFGAIEPKASNGHRFILVAIDYFTKWVEEITLKSVSKKVVVDFEHSNLICCFGIPATIITDYAINLNSHLMGEICEQFKIMHQNSTPYRPKANGGVEAANKNIKKILRKMIQSSR
ncbi:uncharacterized protein [Nicotiana sylvestris]|uniref:uncharacterized protein n=1 Tax=Nicotiana sylvestris TaxID=4096 RepID=UPI00388CC43B